MRARDVLHFYLNCECLTDQNERVRLTSVDFCLPDKSITMITVRQDKEDDDWFVLNDNEDLDRVKLILRPLSDMTKEEGAHCLSQVFFPHVKYPIRDFKLELVGDGQQNPRISIDNDWFTENLTFGNNKGSIWACDTRSQNVKIEASLFAWLISKEFDVFGLIAAGEAYSKLQPIPNEKKA